MKIEIIETYTMVLAGWTLLNTFFAFYVWSELRAMQQSTHQVQFVPADKVDFKDEATGEGGGDPFEDLSIN